MSGWLAIKRGVHEHPIFHKNPERLYVWLWILATAAWKDTKQDAGGKTVEVKRGQLLTSYRQISDATGVGVKVVRNLIDRLKAEHALDTATGTGRLLITICNYEKYQSAKDAPGTAQGTAGAQQGHTKETREQTLPSEDASASADPVKVLFDSGIKLLGAAGIKNQQARTLIGKWRKDHSEAAIIEAMGRAQREGAIDPVGFIEGCLRFTRQKQNQPQDGTLRVTPSGVVQEFSFGQWIRRNDLEPSDVA